MLVIFPTSMVAFYPWRDHFCLPFMTVPNEHLYHPGRRRFVVVDAARSVCSMHCKAYTYLVDKEESARIEDGLAALSKEVIVYSTSKGAFEGLRSYTGEDLTSERGVITGMPIVYHRAWPSTGGISEAKYHVLPCRFRRRGTMQANRRSKKFNRT